MNGYRPTAADLRGSREVKGLAHTECISCKAEIHKRGRWAGGSDSSVEEGHINFHQIKRSPNMIAWFNASFTDSLLPLYCRVTQSRDVVSNPMSPAVTLRR